MLEQPPEDVLMLVHRLEELAPRRFRVAVAAHAGVMARQVRGAALENEAVRGS
jgi:hypothetical protein